jgi:heme exporter protein CcmD
MTSADHSFYIVAAYGVTVVLLVAEVWSLVRRSRALAREQEDVRRAR